MKNEAIFIQPAICPSAQNRFANPATLFDSLSKTDSCAIRYLQGKTLGFLSLKQHRAKATPSDIEELTNDAVLLTLQKIGNGSFRFRGFSPLTFCSTVAENLLRNFARKKRLLPSAIDGLEVAADAEIETCLQQREVELQIGRALATLDEPCRQVILLKYFEGLPDAEVVAKKMTLYSTVDSLKNKRCGCLKKLAGSMLR